MKKGFTLAEVLITLGIIGIVAALTMPALIANYKKKVLETRIKKFNSVIRQAINMKQAQDGALDASAITAVNSPDVALRFFEDNYAPYIKTTTVEKTQKGVAIGFPEGSGMYIRRTLNAGCTVLDGTSRDCTYVVFCVDYKKCKNIDESDAGTVITDGKDTFLFYTSGNTERWNWNGTREQIVTRCAYGTNPPYYGTWCAALLEYDGWEVKDDYPIKF